MTDITEKNTIMENDIFVVMKDKTMVSKNTVVVSAACENHLHFMYDNIDIQFNHWNFLSIALFVGSIYANYKRIPSKYKNYTEMAKLFKNGKM